MTDVLKWSSVDQWVDATPVTPIQIAQVLLVGCGLIFTGFQFGRTARAARVSNLLALTKNHRELWTMLLNDPRFREVLHQSRDVQSVADLTHEERVIVNFFLLHMASSFELEHARMIIPNKMAASDIAGIISRPAFLAVWNSNAKFHRRRFRRYVTKALSRQASA